MDIPANLRTAIEQCLHNTAMEDLTRASARLSSRYRAEIRDGHMHLADNAAAKAYLAARLPATYAAVFSALAATAEQLDGFSPKTLLDAGAGPGTALFAAAAFFPGLQQATLYEQSADITRLGQFLCGETIPFPVHWASGNLLARPGNHFPQAGLVTLAYVLDELESEQQDQLAEQLWQKTTGILVIIEPGTPAGWRRLIRIREKLLQQGAFIAAPCPHAAACPLVAPDWCHFSVRVARSRFHRLAKQADIGWEDEKYAYMAFSRQKPNHFASRVLAHPRKTAGQITLKLCNRDGTAAFEHVSKRNAGPWKTAKKARWGSAVEE